MTEKSITVHQAFVAACGQVENVKRDTDGQVGNQKYKYANLGSVLEMLHPILKENNLALAQFVDGDDLVAQLIHESGGILSFGKYALGPIAKHQDRGSAITYGRRYQLTSIFGITQEDDDGAAASKDKTKVFSSAAKRNDWGGKLENLMRNAIDLEELKGIWTEYLPTLNELKNSADDYEQVSFEHLEKVKEQCKKALTEAGKILNDEIL